MALTQPLPRLGKQLILRPEKNNSCIIMMYYCCSFIIVCNNIQIVTLRLNELKNRLSVSQIRTEGLRGYKVLNLI